MAIETEERRTAPATAGRTVGRQQTTAIEPAAGLRAAVEPRPDENGAPRAAARRMIFYAIGPVEDGGAAAGGLRVHRRAMLAAFRALGYEVDVVDGRMATRIPAMRRVRDRIAAGLRYEFLYMENSTLPLHLSDPRLALVRRHPLADAAFLRYCRRHGIPVGVFNNDVHWRFPFYRLTTPRQRRWARTPFYYLEYGIYARFADIVYVPHIAMKDHLPGRFRRVAMLPHGAEDPRDRRRSGTAAAAPARAPKDRIRLFYVGGLGPLYRLHALIDALRRVDGVTMTLCCRRTDWERYGAEYGALPSDKVAVVHESGPGLLPHYEAADVLSCFLAPDPYLRVTLPVKVFEYLSYGKPILATRDTNAGQFVLDNDIGWAVADDADEVAALLAGLRHRSAEIAAKAANVRRILPQHTWRQRAQQVCRDLRALSAHAADAPL